MKSKLIFESKTLTNADLNAGVSYNQSVNSQTDMTPGTAAMAEVSFSVRDLSACGITEDMRFSWMCIQAHNHNYVTMGTFTVSEIVKTGIKSANITAFDDMKKFDEYADNWLSSITFPITLYNLLISLCTAANVPLATQSITNGSFVCYKKIASTDITMRTVLQYICEISASFAYMGNDGKLYLRYYESTDIFIDNTKYTKIISSDYIAAPTSKVKLHSCDDRYISSAGNGNNLYIIQNNPLINVSSALEIVTPVQNISAKLSQIEYTPMTMNMLCDYGIRAGDIITVDGTQTVVMSLNIATSGVIVASTGGKTRQKTSNENKQVIDQIKNDVLNIQDNYLSKSDAKDKYANKNELSAEFNTYLDSDAGTAKIKLICDGKYVNADGLDTSVRAAITAEIDNTGGSIKSYVEGKGYMTVTQANNTYIISTRLYAGIEAYINTAMGEAKIISACSGTYQTAEGMSSYPTTTVMNSSITQSVNNKFATLALSTTSTTGNNQTSSTISIKSGTATLGSSVTISATTATQAATIAASAVNGITLSVSNGTQSSTITMKNGTTTIAAQTIQFTGSINYPWGPFYAGRNYYPLVINDENAFYPHSSMYPGYIGTSSSPFGYGYFKKLYVDGKEVTVSGGSSSETYISKLYAGTSTSYFCQYTSNYEFIPSISSSSYSYPSLGTSSYPWKNAYIGNNICQIGYSASSKLGFYGASPITKQSLSTYSNDMGYSSATASNYLYILNNVAGILKNLGLLV